MKQTSRMSRSRSVQGSRPSTFNSPWYGVRPRIALSAVVLPAPLGPMSPRMRPSSTRKSTPSNAMVVPNALRSPRASMHAMASTLLRLRVGLRARLCITLRIRRSTRRWPAVFEQLFRVQAEALNGGRDPRPFFRQKFLAFPLQQQAARAGFDEHAQASPLLDQLFDHQLLIALQDRERIDAIIGGDIAHRGQGIALFEHAVEDHRHDSVAKLAVDRLTVVPFKIHSVFRLPKGPRSRHAGSLDADTRSWVNFHYSTTVYCALFRSIRA